MKGIFFLSLYCIYPFILYSQDEALKIIANEIKIENLKKKVYFLASDSLQGRNTYQKGQKEAAAYIAGYFRQNNLQQIENADSFYQVLTRYKVQQGYSFIRKKEDIEKKHRFPFSLSFANSDYTDTSDVEFVFAGRATEKDLSGLDVKNKALVFFADSLIQGIQKVNELSTVLPGTKMVICLNNKRNLPRFVNLFKQKLIKISQVKSFNDLTTYYYRLCADEITREKLETAEFIKDRLDSDRRIGFSVISEEHLELIFEIKAKKLYKLSRKNVKSKNNLLTHLPNPVVNHSIKCMHKTDTLTTENIIAYIEGTEKKGEAIVVSAHYDHLGIKYNGGVCLGADDNASGTAALMEIASAFAKAAEKGIRPKRSVVFIAFTGEEKGLVGSWHYVNNPLFPLDKTLCNINMDMIGRNHNDKMKNSNKVFLVGRNKKKHQRKRAFQNINKHYKLVKLDTHPPFIHKLMWMFGSDHHAFQLKDVPSMVIFTGNHKDYHTPADTPDKLNYEKLTKIARLVFLSVWELADKE